MTTQNTFITILDHERLVSFTGAENRKFLQGQVTCDINKLTEGESALGACCNPKGRVIANFRMVAVGEDLVISLPSDQSEHLSEHLKKYAAFFRTVTITDTTAQWQRIGISGADAVAIVAELTDTPAVPNTQSWQHGLIVPVDDQRFELWINTDESFQTIWQDLAQQSTVAPVSHWQREDIRSGIAWITEASREAWIPQHLNWQALDGISFKKGCYTGQEIVARMKYLGKLKSHLYRLSAPMSDNTSAETIVGTAIINSAGSKCGDIVVAESNQERNIELLAIVRKDDVEAGQLTLADGTTPLTLQPLPYSIEE